MAYVYIASGTQIGDMVFIQPPLATLNANTALPEAS
jgi:hypothetical protein